MKVVLDTNVLVSSLLFGGSSRKVYDYCIENSDVFISDFLLTELEEKLSTKFGLKRDMLLRIVESIDSAFLKVIPETELPNLCRDADDNHVLQLCESADANFLITGDKDLLILRQFRRTAIISPSAFLKNVVTNPK